VSDIKKPESWLSLARAAEFLDETPTGLRKKLDRASALDEHGLVRAKLPGLQARKFGKLWKIRLDRGWL
jgi:hypothetical protein